ncbi:hypothetical protein, partial [Agilicoccus flavus]|uniref:hypothetical protein n=1 Tax=Agilicoccus flavus TaxID=2775968 RepID=UPI001CF6C6FB
MKRTPMLDHAQMITAEAPREAAVVLTRELGLTRPAADVASARLVATAHGVYEARIDGRPVSGS